VIQGDKLMRLPSFSPQDQREMIQSLSSTMGGPEAVVDAEEYLQPSHSRGGMVSNSTSGTMSVGSGSSPPHTPTKKWSAAGSVAAASIMAESPLPPNWDTIRYGGSQHSYPSRHHMGSESTDPSKYCTDPMKMPDKGMQNAIFN